MVSLPRVGMRYGESSAGKDSLAWETSGTHLYTGEVI